MMSSNNPVLTGEYGLHNHRILFALLVLSNFFVGGMVGLERTVLPLLAEAEFGLTSTAAALSFIASFGVSKAIVNFFAGRLSDHYGRKVVLLTGWLIAVPIPYILINAEAWRWILLANVLLGVSQAFTWSMTVVMKVDIAGSKQRGFAIGLNEFAGYGGVAVIALLSGLIAEQFQLRPEPFYLGYLLIAIGLLLAVVVKDTRQFVEPVSEQEHQATPLSLFSVFKQTTWQNASLSSASVSGLMTNFKDGMLWGLLPIYLLSQLNSGYMTLTDISIIVATYPVVWSVLQLIFGPWSDRVGRKKLVVFGLIVQSIGIYSFVLVGSFIGHLLAAAIVGMGTAMVYPTLLALISDVAPTHWRATSLGIYRFWRDLGYALGAISAGLLSDLLNIHWTLTIVALLVLLAAISGQIRIKSGL
ncbi:MAG: MFS transporter [Kangiellaceae bacterium]|jgi:MFS family permease|nr:MFS transporter [Kangiellaceae bacterium]